jgi:hypothetical protein
MLWFLKLLSNSATIWSAWFLKLQSNSATICPALFLKLQSNPPTNYFYLLFTSNARTTLWHNCWDHTVP